MPSQDAPVATPWQRISAKFGLKPAELARALHCHRSKISRALKDEKGLINGRDQERILTAAKERNVAISPADMVAGA